MKSNHIIIIDNDPGELCGHNVHYDSVDAEDGVPRNTCHLHCEKGVAYYYYYYFGRCLPRSIESCWIFGHDDDDDWNWNAI